MKSLNLFTIEIGIRKKNRAKLFIVHFGIISKHHVANNQVSYQGKEYICLSIE